jgi:hypothetical protein
MIQTLFPNNDAGFQDDIAPIHTAELFSHDLKSMRVNFSIFHGQHNHQIWKSMNHFFFFQVWRHSASVKQVEDVLQEERYKIPLETVRNWCDSIPGRIAAMLKTKLVQHNINKGMCVVFPLFGQLLCLALLLLRN